MSETQPPATPVHIEAVPGLTEPFYCSDADGWHRMVVKLLRAKSISDGDSKQSWVED